MIRKTLAVLVVGIFAMMGLVASASADERGECWGYAQDQCKPSYPPKPPHKPDKPDCDRDHGWCESDKPSRPDHPTTGESSSTTTSTSTGASTATSTTASTRLAQTGANDNTVLLLAVGGGLVVIGGAAFAVSRLRRQT